MALLEETASRAALVVDNVRRYARERHAAVSLQRSLLPPTTTDETADAGTAHDHAPRAAFDSYGATCLYLTYDPVTRHCVVASAGHPPPALLRPDGTVGHMDVSPGPPLGVGGLPFEPLETEVEANSVLALYTDAWSSGAGPTSTRGWRPSPPC